MIPNFKFTKHFFNMLKIRNQPMRQYCKISALGKTYIFFWSPRKFDLFLWYFVPPGNCEMEMSSCGILSKLS